MTVASERTSTTFGFVEVPLISLLLALTVACAPAPIAPSTIAPPTQAPQPTAAPAASPTRVPTSLPTATPTRAPTVAPTQAPTVAPTLAPATFDIKPTLVSYLAALPDGFGGIQPSALKDQLASKPFILDVREPNEIAQNGFIEGAVNIPLRTLTKNFDKLPAKDQPIITVCPSGQKGGIAMTVLQILGYTKVKNLVGGFNAWKAANMPIATASPAAPVAAKAPDLDKDLFAAVDKYVSALPDGFGGIQPAALRDQIAANKVTLIDVREATEIAQTGKIEGSMNLPLRTLLANPDKLPADKAVPIATYCPVGQRGVIAMTTLQLLGYTNVKNLVGGFNAWTAANLPIVK